LSPIWGSGLGQRRITSLANHSRSGQEPAEPLRELEFAAIAA